MGDRLKTVLLTSVVLLGGALILGGFVSQYSNNVLEFRLPTSAEEQEAFWTRFYYIAAVSILVERSVEVYLKVSQQDGGAVVEVDGVARENPDATRVATIASLILCVLLAVVGLRLLESLLQPMLSTAAAADAGAATPGAIVDGAAPEPPDGEAPTPATEHPWIMSLFFGVDVIVSAGLMAGGAAIFHPLAKALTQIFEGLQRPEGRKNSTNWAIGDQTRATADAPSGAPLADHFEDHSVLRARSIDDLNLKEPALAGAKALLNAHPDVVFTSGYRDVAGQARAMAGNVVQNRRWIEQTYVATAERTQLQDWVDAHPEAKTQAEIAAGLESVMTSWTDSQKKNISRHMIGLAFDLKPMSGENGAKVMATIENLPKKHKFLTKEGGLVIWHVQFEMP